MYKVVRQGQGGAHPTDADVALVNYEGKLLNGDTFDKSAQPTPMPVKSVVPGFSEALKLLTKGAKYRFWIKPSLAYGDKANGPIPANSTLVFDVELLDFMSRIRAAPADADAADDAAAGRRHARCRWCRPQGGRPRRPDPLSSCRAAPPAPRRSGTFPMATVPPTPKSPLTRSRSSMSRSAWSSACC